MTARLRTAAQALVDRWDSPQWGGSAEHLRHTGEYIAELRAALAEQPAEQEPVEMSPEFTDTARSALLWVLWHHQGGSSPVGQPIRFALGMGAHDHLNERQVAEAKRWAAQTGSTTAEFHAPQPAIPPGWATAYAAFKGAFDTPLARRRDSSEFAQDARRLLRELNDAMLAVPEAPRPAKPIEIDWSQAGSLMDAAASAKHAGCMTGTTNWAAHVYRYMVQAKPAKRVPLTHEQAKAMLVDAGYEGAVAQHRADFINGLLHGITGQPATEHDLIALQHADIARNLRALAECAKLLGYRTPALARMILDGDPAQEAA